MVDQAADADRSQIFGDIEIGAIALCSRPIRKRLFAHLSTPPVRSKYWLRPRAPA